MDVQDSPHHQDLSTPTLSGAPFPPPQDPSSGHGFDLSSQKTPTRESFAASLPPSGEKRPHETSPSPDPQSVVTAAGESENPDDPQRATSEHSDSQDVRMTDDDPDLAVGSDDESVTGSGGRPSKKKKGQRFFCTDFPPCNLSFTRSEHLARHIRKHTGERPFQCHCLRRFSRLDNLRQHAQTVHVNEDIPGDSLAATGTRFQRQIRTDRVRPAAGGRARASTLSSAGSHSRGHSRNLSGSSIGSVTDYGSPEDVRRRPHSINMAQGPPARPGLTVDTLGASAIGSDPHHPPSYPFSPSGYSTPTSMLSADPSSPRAPSGLQSPIAMVPRPIGWGGQNHSRRLSVPSSSLQSPNFHFSPSTSFVSPFTSSPASGYPPSSSTLGSPMRSSNLDSHQESLSAAEAEWRRRTWHPGTRFSTESRPATSGLSYYQTPDAPQPVSSAQPAAQQAIRLPGIDSFDRAGAQPLAPPRSNTSEMDVDETSQAGETDTSSKRDSWNSVNQNFHHLDIAQGTPPKDNAFWRHSTGSHPPSAARPTIAPQVGASAASKPVPPPLAFVSCRDAPDVANDQPTTPRRKKRQGLYMAPAPEAASGPGPAVRTSPDGSSSSGENIPTPSNYPHAEYQPAIVHSNGFIEPRAPEAIMEETPKEHASARPELPAYHLQNPVPTNPTGQEGLPSRRSDDTGRLDALVAVATGDGQAFAQR